MIKRISALLIVALLFYGCESQNNQKKTTQNSFEKNTPKGQASVVDDVSAKNILQVAISSKDHTTLVAAVQAAEIEHVLVNAGPLTVFAPTNAAFDALPEGTVSTLLKPENKSKLAFILTNHAAPGSFDQAKLKKEARKKRKLYTAAGEYLEVLVDGNDIVVGGAKVLATIQTSNGVINVVDKVIVPEEK